ncbi:glycosyltransferase family 2 protein, partial [bacterium]|nr:glycosyltransferase family 2 protein [bacterium]
MDLSVIIINYNTREYLEGSIESLFSKTKGITFEVIVVDNGSEDGSSLMVEKDFPSIKLVKNDKNLGFTRANNQGINIASGDYLLLLNSDTILNESSIKPVLSYMKDNPDVCICGCKHFNSDGTLQPSCFHFPNIITLLWDLTLLSRAYPKSRIFGRYAMTYWDYNITQEVDRIMGSYLMISRKVIDKIGLLDEDFFIYEEETDWCYRAK